MAKRSKNWYQSKTIWLAVLQGVIGVIVAVTTEYPELATVGWLVLVKSGLDVAIRLMTDKPLSL